MCIRDRVRAYTMLGDVAADAYAMLMPKYGFRTLIEMLQTLSLIHISEPTRPY